jgi:hypothetical protein
VQNLHLVRLDQLQARWTECGWLMDRKPVDVALAAWQEVPGLVIEGIPTAAHRRKVHDGILTVLVAEEPQGWHLSISHRHRRPGMKRYPSWDEIAQARYQFLPGTLTFAMFLPPLQEYVAVHDTTFHLHQIAGESDE